jgi:23S rRNA (uracil1939-C5)-methyltransferase
VIDATIDVRIDSIAAGGDGVGRHEGMVVFTPRTAPGDIARVRARRHDRLMRGRLEALVVASPLRADPPCVHFVRDRCGGCQLQHLQYPAQLDAKRGIIRDALTRIGAVAAEPPEVRPSALEFRYRSKLTLALRRRSGRWIAGLHRYDAPDEVFALEDCLITGEPVLRAWAAVMDQQAFFPRANELRGAVRLTEEGCSFTLEGGREWQGHRQLFDAVPNVTELWWKPHERPRRQLHARPGGDAAGASFVQVNPHVATELRERVLALATGYAPRTVVDAYSGSGTFALSLAERGARVVAIERDRDASRLAASRLPAGSRAIAAAVEDALEDALPADVVILNPPRTGVDARVARILESKAPKPRAIVYVSCNPATLARDLKRMAGYSVKSLIGFDMFPQTAHVETLCELVPAA